jgi:hypothetical protein
MPHNVVYSEKISRFIDNDRILDALGYKLMGWCFRFRGKNLSDSQSDEVKSVCSDLLVIQGRSAIYYTCELLVMYM